MKQNDIAEAIAFYNRKPETLVRHIIPVLDCDLVVYHRPGTQVKATLFFIMELVAVVRCGPTSMMPLKDLTSTLSMLEDRVNHL